MSENDTWMRRLSDPFDGNKVKQKRGQGGRTMSYISHGNVTERLNQVVPGWHTIATSTHTYTGQDGSLHCAGVEIQLCIDGVCRSEAGGPQRQSIFADEIKNAYSDALKRAAMRFGVALGMWEGSLDAEGDEDYQVDQQTGEITEQPLPPRARNVSQNTIPAERPQARSGVEISEKQVGMIRAMQKRLDMSDAELHEIAGVASLNDLDRAQASALIDELKSLEGGAPTPEPVNGQPSWTAFWQIARPYGFQNKADVEKAIGTLPDDPREAAAKLTRHMDAMARA